jgi:cobyrinic acid a,c-diamide synthase
VTQARLPRVVVAGLAGDTGKSLVAVGLIGALKRRGLRVAPFKKGPDFIDTAWLGKAAGAVGRNLDTFLMPAGAIAGSLGRAAVAADIAVIEGNRGLFDGADEQGTHSTAELAKSIAAPVVLVVDATKATRTLAALVLGCHAMDSDLKIAGVVLNRVGTARQEAIVRKAMLDETGIPVVGAIPRLCAHELPSRHLGLVTPSEHQDASGAIARVTEAVEDFVDVEAIVTAAGRAADLVVPPSHTPAPVGHARIGVLRDKAFSFYYPENLEALSAAGAEIITISPLGDRELPEIDALYAGGGFPEEFAQELQDNRSLRDALRRRIASGLPVWAECGGLMYLSTAVVKDGVTHPMVGALPITVEHTPRPQGHGYVEARVDHANPFLRQGAALRGHEFHYSRLSASGDKVTTVLALDRGTGIGLGRDGIWTHKVVATYTHIHALGVPEWAPALVRAAIGGSATGGASA